MLATSLGLGLGLDARQDVKHQADFELRGKPTACLHAGAPPECPELPLCTCPVFLSLLLNTNIVNIRHIQHHAAVLSSRLRRTVGIGIDWVDKGYSILFFFFFSFLLSHLSSLYLNSLIFNNH